MDSSDLCYSLDDADFKFTSKKDLFQELKEQNAFNEGTPYYEAKMVRVTSDHIDVTGQILDVLDVSVEEDLGEVYDYLFADASEEAKQELTDLIRKWTAKHIDLSCYWKVVGESKAYAVTKEDLLEHADEGHFRRVSAEEHAKIVQAVKEGRIAAVSDDKIVEHYETCGDLLEVMGHSIDECLVTDLSSIADFVGDQDESTIRSAIKQRFGIEVHATDTLAHVCEIIDSHR